MVNRHRHEILEELELMICRFGISVKKYERDIVYLKNIYNKNRGRKDAPAILNFIKLRVKMLNDARVILIEYQENKLYFERMNIH